MNLRKLTVAQDIDIDNDRKSLTLIYYPSSNSNRKPFRFQFYFYILSLIMRLSKTDPGFILGRTADLWTMNVFFTV